MSPLGCTAVSTLERRMCVSSKTDSTAALFGRVFDHAGRTRWAVDRSYCGSINQRFLHCTGTDFCTASVWMCSACAAVTSAVQVASGWILLTATFTNNTTTKMYYEIDFKKQVS